MLIAVSQLMARSKSWREKMTDSVKSAAKAIDSTFNTHIVRISLALCLLFNVLTEGTLALLSVRDVRFLLALTRQDPDPFFEEHRNFIVIYAPA
jgi:hypothetical protein